MLNRLRSFAVQGALAALVVTGPACLASEIYKWTDENGVVHFGDRPVLGAERIVHIESGRTDPARVQARVQSARAARPSAGAPAGAAQAAAKQDLTEEEQRQQEKERAQKCAMYKERLQTFLTSRRLYREDENGERVYLSEEETLAARAKVQEQIVEYCD